VGGGGAADGGAMLDGACREPFPSNINNTDLSLRTSINACLILHQITSQSINQWLLIGHVGIALMRDSSKPSISQGFVGWRLKSIEMCLCNCRSVMVVMVIIP
jgi:hypothetical protein